MWHPSLIKFRASPAKNRNPLIFLNACTFNQGQHAIASCFKTRHLSQNWTIKRGPWHKPCVCPGLCLYWPQSPHKGLGDRPHARIPARLATAQNPATFARSRLLPARHPERGLGALVATQSGRWPLAAGFKQAHRSLGRGAVAPLACQPARAAGALAAGDGIPVRASAPRSQHGDLGRFGRHLAAHLGRGAVFGQGRARGLVGWRHLARSAARHQRHRHRLGRSRRGRNQRRRTLPGAQRFFDLRGSAHFFWHRAVVGGARHFGRTRPPQPLQPGAGQHRRPQH